MKKVFFTLVFTGFLFSAIAQEVPQVGDELIVKAPKHQNYDNIDFPKRNILTKRTKVANYKSVYDKTVVIDKVITDDDGNNYVMLKTKDGSKFFGIKSSIKANYNKAIEAGELVSFN
ncbi:hypothetical protein [Winogradskyella sp. A3E31]|uniref:hypothetical protein n=1 Tax=Winogradskyella sp. A3E31 TaxID=3349637 RepID=UPI00398A50E4